MAACEMRPADKRALLGAVGEELTKRHGKQRYYRPDDVRSAALDLGFALDVHCWAYCMFSSPGDFRAVHEAMGEACDYMLMKGELLADLAGDGSFALPDLDLSWLEWPDIDLSAIFDWFDWS